MTTKPVNDLDDRELAIQLDHVAKMIDGGPIGNSLRTRSRIAALNREAARRLKWPNRRKEPSPSAQNPVAD